MKPVDQIAHALVGDLLPEIASVEHVEPPEDVCKRCGRRYLVWPHFSYGLCGVHTVEIEILLGEEPAP